MVSNPNSRKNVIEILDSDSDGEDARRAIKRQKIATSTMSADSCFKNFNKNSSLKGRKRWTADLDDVVAESKSGSVLYNVKVKRIRTGDDEGSVEVFLRSATDDPIVSLALLCSDTSDYPKSHNFFSYSLEGDMPPQLSSLAEDLASAPPRTVGETVSRLCRDISRIMNLGGQDDFSESQEPEMVEDDSEDEEYDAFDEFDGEFLTGARGHAPKVNQTKLQYDFVETVATAYRPGFIRFGPDDFSLSTSLPILSLTDTIPPRALMAWDRRLLSSEHPQNLTLLVSGLRGIYPPLASNGTFTTVAQKTGVPDSLRFKVGLCGNYKPSVEHAKEAGRNFGLVGNDAEDEIRIAAEKAALGAFNSAWAYEEVDPNMSAAEALAASALPVEEEVDLDPSRFDRFSLSSSLESLMDQCFLKVLQYRRAFGLGWAGAELLYQLVEKIQQAPENVLTERKQDILKADKEEALLARNSSILPHDPLQGVSQSEGFNFLLTAFCYLVRRLSLCTRYCTVCHNSLDVDFEALKPYVCDSKLCQYQYYTLNRGPSLEYEIIHNHLTVDLLVAMAYSSANEGAMDEFPVGMAIRVPLPPNSIQDIAVNTAYPQQAQAAAATATNAARAPVRGPDGFVEFDHLGKGQMRAAIVNTINDLPPIDDIRKHLLRKVKPGKSKPKLRDMDCKATLSSWAILRWIVGSCTAYLEPVDASSDELIRNLDPTWRQFRFTVGSPDAEAKFKAAQEQAKKENKNAALFPSLYAFHGSHMRNWHSIIRHGLWFKTVANGRAYGHGVYLAKDGSVSMGHYAGGTRSFWQNGILQPTNCVALAEIVNLPDKFISSNPYFVIADTTWIVCRYLLVRGQVDMQQGIPSTNAVPMVKLDSKHPVVLSGKVIQIPDPAHQLRLLLDACQTRTLNNGIDEADSEDQAIFEYMPPQKDDEVIEISDDDVEMYEMTSSSAPKSSASAPPPPKEPTLKARPANDWKHNQEWVAANVEKLMPAPSGDASRGAASTILREYQAMLKEQNSCSSYRELGWYLPEEFNGEELFQWVVEMHSFDPEIPIAKDMAAQRVNSVVFEIRFPPNFPLSPPFFRILSPRFLPFIHGGGGHVTGGGSICMDLLTADGWLPSYSISAVLLQIKMAISNLDPRPARLDKSWAVHYSPTEALAGYKRAAATHGWTVPLGLDKLVQGY